MGNSASGHLVDDCSSSIIPAPAPTADSVTADYARESEEAMAIAKANIAEIYPGRKEGPTNQLELVDTILLKQLEDTRDQPNQNFSNSDGNRSMTTMNREESHASPIQLRHAPVFIPTGSYKLTAGETIDTRHAEKNKLPVMSLKQTILHPLQQRQQIEKKKDNPTHHSPVLSQQQDIEAKNLLQKIINLDTEATEATAAVYHYLETKRIQDEMSPSGHAREVIRNIKNELRKGNSKPAYQFLETAKAVIPVLREDAGKLLEADIFSEDSDDSAILPLQSASFSKDGQGGQDDLRSISEQTAAIFQFLDDVKKTLGKGDVMSMNQDPVGSQKFHGRTGSSSGNIFRILEEKEDGSMKDDIFMRMQLRENAGNKMTEPIDLEDISNFYTIDVGDMDLEFVEHFDLAYSEFLFYHPKLVAKNPNLLKNLRIYKLQKLLEYNEVLERSVTTKLELMKEENKANEESMQLQLKNAVKGKAARQTFFQSEVNNMNWGTKKIQAQLRWKFLKYSEDRAKRQFKLREQFKTIHRARSRQELIPLIPEGPNGKKLKNAIKASVIAEGGVQADSLSSKQEEKLQDIQVENSVVTAEIAMLNQELSCLQIEANKLEWVQSILVRLDDATICKLKEKFEKMEGILV